jgi:hypothetical protein
MPFDFGDHSAGFQPASGLIREACMGSVHVSGRAANRAFEQIADPLLQDAVRRQANGVFDPFGFEELVDIGIGEPASARK